MRVLLVVLAIALISGTAFAQSRQTWTMPAGLLGAYFVDFPGKPVVRFKCQGLRAAS